MSTREIARRRGVSLDAAKFHVANALDKLGLSSRAQLRHWTGVPVDSALASPPPTGTAAPMKGAAAMTDSQGAERTGTDRGRADGPPRDAGADALRLGPIGQISRQVSDVQAAERWYRDVLGLPHLYTFGDPDGHPLALMAQVQPRVAHEPHVS
jgi:hypothetical protein